MPTEPLDPRPPTYWELRAQLEDLRRERRWKEISNNFFYLDGSAREFDDRIRAVEKKLKELENGIWN